MIPGPDPNHSQSFSPIIQPTPIIHFAAADSRYALATAA
jgi:hypothetical protein